MDNTTTIAAVMTAARVTCDASWTGVRATTTGDLGLVMRRRAFVSGIAVTGAQAPADGSAPRLERAPV